MALFEYFSPAVGKDKLLPDPNGLLSGELVSSAIASANAEVKKVLEDG